MDEFQDDIYICPWCGGNVSFTEQISGSTCWECDRCGVGGHGLLSIDGAIEDHRNAQVLRWKTGVPNRPGRYLAYVGGASFPVLVAWDDLSEGWIWADTCFPIGCGVDRWAFYDEFEDVIK